MSNITRQTPIREKLKSEYILYTIFFLIMSGIIFSPFLISGKSFIWNVDGINQHYPSLLYYGEWLRGLFKGEVLMFDFRVGMGFDVLTTLNYYAIGDPITLFTIFATKDNIEFIYMLLILLRFYLAGISFMAYCSYRGQKGVAVIIGSFLYIFCGYALYAGVRHPYFLNPLIYLPILFIGMEQILRRRKPYIFIIGVCISSISNFYFLYMLTILVFIYAVIRYFTNQEEWMEYGGASSKASHFFQMVFRSIFYYVIGILLSAFLLLPVAIAFLNNGRFDSGYEMELVHYSFRHYVTVAKSFIAPGVFPGAWVRLNYGAMIPVSLVCILINKKWKELRSFFFIGTFMLVIPAFGYLMNGFSYVSNRWEFGYSFLMAYIFVATFDELFHYKNKKLKSIILIVGTLGYGVLAIKSNSVYVWGGLLFLILFTVIVILATHYGERYELITERIKKERMIKYGVYMIAVFTIINICFNGVLTFHSDFKNYVGEFINKGKVYETIKDSPVSLTSDIEDNGFYRVETFGDKQHNESMTLSYYDTAGYFSVMDKRIPLFFRGLELLNLRTAYRFDDLDYRTALGTLANVKYIVTRDKNMAPYGYEVIREVDRESTVYYLLYNKNHLPLGYVYHQFITAEDYEKLNSIEKEQVMLDHVVILDTLENLGFRNLTIKESIENTVDRNHISSLGHITSLEVSFLPEEGIQILPEGIEVTKAGAKLKIIYESPKNSETYLRLEDFHINETSHYAVDLKVKGEGEVTKTLNLRSNRHNTYFGKKDYTINLGYSPKSRSYSEITFSKKGFYHLGSLDAFSVPMKGYESKIQALKEEVLTNTLIENNRIEGSISLKEDGILSLSIPYSKGWTAFVDGKKTEILEGNIMYMAVPLTKGEHKIALKYETPFLREGFILSGIGILIFIAVGLYKTKDV